MPPQYNDELVGCLGCTLIYQFISRQLWCPGRGPNRQATKWASDRKFKSSKQSNVKQAEKKMSSCATGRIFISSCKIQPKISNTKFCLSIQQAKWATDQKNGQKKPWRKLFGLTAMGQMVNQPKMQFCHHIAGWNFFGLIATGGTGKQPKMKFLHNIRSSSRK